jgi:hypothetical protein
LMMCVMCPDASDTLTICGIAIPRRRRAPRRDGWSRRRDLVRRISVMPRRRRPRRLDRRVRSPPIDEPRSRRTRKEQESSFEFGSQTISVAVVGPLAQRGRQHVHDRVVATCALRITRRVRCPLLPLTLELRPLRLLAGIRARTRWGSLVRRRPYVFESCSAQEPRALPSICDRTCDPEATAAGSRSTCPRCARS